MAEKSSFVLYDKYQAQIDLLTDEQAGRIFKAIFAHRQGVIAEVNDPVVNILLSVITQQMDADNRKYAEVCERKRIAGQKGGLAKASNTKQGLAEASSAKQKLAEASNTKQSLANVADNDCEYENDNENEKDNNPPISPQGEWHSLFSPELAAQVDKWLRYKIERRESYKPTGLNALVSRIKNMAEKHGDKAVIDLIELCMANGWRGIIWDRLAGGAGVKINSQQQPKEDSNGQSGINPSIYEFLDAFTVPDIE